MKPEDFASERDRELQAETTDADQLTLADFQTTTTKTTA